MAFILVRHKVADYGRWRPKYDDHEGARKDAGLSEVQCLHSESDPNEVVLLFKCEDLERARAFSTSDDLRDVMKKAGVIGSPEILFLRSDDEEAGARQGAGKETRPSMH